MPRRPPSRLPPPEPLVRTLLLVAAGLLATAPMTGRAQVEPRLGPPLEVASEDPSPDDGRTLVVTWQAADGPVTGYVVERAPAMTGPWTRAGLVPAAILELEDRFPDAHRRPWIHRVAAYHFPDTEDAPDPALDEEEPDDAADPLESAVIGPWAHTEPLQATYTAFDIRRLPVFLAIAVVGLLMGFFLYRVRRGDREIYVRRIAGIDAIEESVGRATEMGRPVLYVPGIADMQEVQTIASLLILGKVAEMVGRYNSKIIVPNRIPFVMTVAEEVVRQGFYDAGRPDAHDPENIRFLSDEQFAFTAGTNGIMLRERPATNLFLGQFYAESLLLAETGFQTRAIQVAGTADVTQLPFFIAACDYTLIGEELFAASAYFSRDPMLLSTLKAGDWMKVVVIATIVGGAAAELFGVTGIRDFLQLS